ncbi:MAG: hypothetical protein GYA55_08455 [SAR324 cluster bacterium]|uniref:Holliday junction resolvase-related domain-containing protein n=1 Tax=SAR324 cluster bacterium TaxID=2024889 RepID=A0A7X9FS31_9DELT|nr:hypothetical protein [SAR324 cluster bacterium]
MKQTDALNLALNSPEAWIYIGLAVLLLFLFVFRKQIIRKIFALDDIGQQILEQKKSSEVRIGRIVEAISPVLKDFPVDVKKEGTSLAYVGKPIDYIHFDPNVGITFIEIKSGNAKLSSDQKKLKALVNQGKISWVEYRVK